MNPALLKANQENQSMLLFIITKHQICAKTSVFNMTAGGEKRRKKNQPLGLFTVKPYAAVSDPGRTSATPGSGKTPHCPHQPTETRWFQLQTKLQKKKRRKLYGSTPAAPTRPPDCTCSLQSFNGPLVKTTDQLHLQHTQPAIIGF